ncbi:DnaJ domain [Arabidopsis thaliana x Arabidopsis arenosa]|uniref:DnaJ domain n=1 Tax=Arabidopsis thaliana x Arabidopsis arenosa TaxID=1240361 RepID=A0A8T1YBT4_9BRAS|nr:DnaJ domain [Arabidopsis thaliana x Arabidopsis arenosa]
MEAYREEAFKATQIAEKRFAEKDFAGARSYALRAKSLFPDLEGLSQMLTTYEVYIASQSRRSGKIDYYAVLGLKPSAGKREVKKQYKNMVVLLHPDKNKCLGVNGAFQIISEAWSFLSIRTAEEHLLLWKTGPAPVSASIQYAPPSHTTSNGYRAHGYDAVSRMPTNSTYFLVIKASRPENKRNVGLGLSGNGFVENITKYNLESKATNLDTKMEHEFKHPGQSYGSMRRWSSAIGLDTRKLLINKVKTDIKQRLEIMRLASEDAVAASEAVAIEDATPLDDVSASSKVGDDVSRMGKNVSSGHPPVRKINGPITVRDSDFHDFDTNRSEECFEGRQLWAIYDEDDGMPRLYCMVREVFFVQPFKIDIAYLSSKTDIKFGTMKWVQYGFTKSCGHFRIRNTNIVDHVNIFSHLLKGKKTGRDEVRHQYKMIEIFDEYSEQFGVCFSPLVKVEGYKTVYCRRDKEESKKWIPRREMLRFSHQVPSWFLKEETSGVPRNCWDLDPAAIPEELLHNGAGTD